MATGFSAVGIVITCLAPIALYLNQTGSYDRDPRGFIIGAIAALCFSGWQWKRALNRLGAALCSIESAAAVAPLLDLLAEGAASPSGHVRRALTKVLPKMMPGDGATISDLQRAALRRLLLAGDPLLEFDTSKLVELKRSVIKALAQIGDERDILALETMLASYPGDLREEVSDCLNSLLDRHDPTAPQQTLLRPVEAGAGDEALLRAAGSVFSEDGSALVRAVYDREGEASTDEVTLRLSTLSRGV